MGAVWLQTHSWGTIKGSAEDGAEIDLMESAYKADKYAATIHYDGQVVRTVTDPKLISQVKEYPILSHEVLDWAEGDVTQAPLDYRSTMHVDWIRVWQ